MKQGVPYAELYTARYWLYDYFCLETPNKYKQCMQHKLLSATYSKSCLWKYKWAHCEYLKSKVLLTSSKWIHLVSYHRQIHIHCGQNSLHAISQQQSPVFIYNIKPVYINSVIQGLKSGYSVYIYKTQPMLYSSIHFEHCYRKVALVFVSFFFLNLLRSQPFESVNAAYTEDTTEPIRELIMQLTGMGRRKNQKRI